MRRPLNIEPTASLRMRRPLHSLLLVLVACTTASAQDDSKCLRPIHKAAKAGNARRLEDILAKDRFQANAEDKCDSKVRPLMLAAFGGHTRCVELLLNAGANVHVAHGGNGVTPLIAATVTGDEAMVGMMLEKRAQPNVAEGRNWTALSFASQYGHTAVVKRLLEAGADVTWATGAGLTPWMLAHDSKHTEVLALLKAADAPNLDDATLEISGTLPLDVLAAEGVPDAAAFSERLTGRYPFLKVTPGMSAEDLAVYQTMQKVAAGELETATQASSGSLGGGPMPAWSKAAGDAENLVMTFDPRPGNQMWSLLGMPAQAPPQQQPGQGAEAPPAQGAGAFYMRGKPPRTSDALSNELDVLSVEVWEVAVGVVVDEETGRRETKWIRAPGITMARGGGGGGGSRGEAKEEL